VGIRCNSPVSIHCRYSRLQELPDGSVNIREVVHVKLGIVFPGQGAQYVGMGKELMENFRTAREVFEQADEVLGFSLTKLCLEGPLEELRLTFHTQPALLTTSIAAYRVLLQETGFSAEVAAGHSLGEYSALVASSALPFETAVKLVHLRGKWMDEAVPAGQGAMAAILGMESNSLEQVCAKIRETGEIVELANLNCPGQIVISGTAMGVAKASELAKEQGARRAVPLVVSGPFHCSLMKPAAEKLNKALQEADFTKGTIPVVANVDACAYTEPDDVRVALGRQLYSPVLWQQSVETMQRMGAEAYIEFGPGTVLGGLIKKIDRRISTFHVENESTLREVVTALQS
jgi:[acyl-carrier-protein] S-malonyltransferase